jgi:hypothetical protein
VLLVDGLGTPARHGPGVYVSSGSCAFRSPSRGPARSYQAATGSGASPRSWTASPGASKTPSSRYTPAHALGIDYQTYTREQAEVMVDTVTYIVCAGLGLAIDGESVPYVAGWGEHGALDAVNPLRGHHRRPRAPD